MTKHSMCGSLEVFFAARSALQDLTMENHPAAVAGFGPSSLDFSLSGNENQYPAGPVFPDVKSETF